jgi:hypothetical protein
MRLSERGPAKLVLAALLVAVICPSSGSGEDVEALLKKGIELRRHGRDREALVEFQRAAQISRTARVTAQIALAEQALGLWVEAESDMREALASAQDPWIAKNRSVLEGALGTVRNHVGTVEIWGAPEGGEVLLDDKMVGHLPSTGPISFATEDLDLVVRAPGYLQIKRTIHIQIGAANREHVDLRRLPPPERRIEVAVAPVPASKPPPSVDLASQLPAPPPVEDEHAPIYRKWWFWGGVGAVVIGAAAFLVLSRSGGTTHSCPPDISSGQCFPSP